MSYDELVESFCADFWGTSNAWEHVFREQGLEAQLYLINLPEFEAAWRRSTGVSQKEKTFAEDVIAFEKPDVVMVEGLEFFTPAELKRFRDQMPRKSCLVGITGVRLSMREIVEPLDLLFTCRPDLARSIVKDGGNAIRLPHAFDARVLDQMEPEENSTRGTRFGFIGGVLPGSSLHGDRRLILRALAKKIDFPIYSPGNRGWARSIVHWLPRLLIYHIARPFAANLVNAETSNPAIRTLRKVAAWNEAPSLEYISGLTPKMLEPIFGIEMFRVLANMSITLNVQPGISNNYATNMRLFEATGVATCLVTDRTRDIGEFFDDDEVVTYASAEEAVEKTCWLLDHPTDAAAIGRRGQERTLGAHTYKQRANIVLPALSNSLSNRAGGLA